MKIRIIGGAYGSTHWNMQVHVINRAGFQYYRRTNYGFRLIISLRLVKHISQQYSWEWIELMRKINEYK